MHHEQTNRRLLAVFYLKRPITLRIWTPHKSWFRYTYTVPRLFCQTLHRKFLLHVEIKV